MGAVPALPPLPIASGSAVSTLHGCIWCSHAHTRFYSRLGPRRTIQCPRALRNVPNVLTGSTCYRIGSVESVWGFRAASTDCAVCSGCPVHTPSALYLECQNCLDPLDSLARLPCQHVDLGKGAQGFPDVYTFKGVYTVQRVLECLQTSKCHTA